jgi:hypothetical protein
LLTIAHLTFLLCITRREQVAHVLGEPIYAVEDIAILPVLSQRSAEEAILLARRALQKTDRAWDDRSPLSASDESDDEESLDVGMVVGSGACSTLGPESLPTAIRDEPVSGVAQDVIQRKGQYGPFASQWFSKRGWGLGNKAPELKSRPGSQMKSRGRPDESNETGPSKRTPHEAAVKMLPKIIRTTKLLFSSGGFYFSYDINLTKRMSGVAARSRGPVSLDSPEEQVWELSTCLPAPLLTIRDTVLLEQAPSVAVLQRRAIFCDHADHAGIRRPEKLYCQGPYQ